MRIPSSREQFASVLALCNESAWPRNESAWPLQWLLIALAVSVIILVVRRSHRLAATAGS